MPSRAGILMGLVLVAGIAAPGCGCRPVKAPAPPAGRQAEDSIRLMSELLKASPTVLTVDGQSFLVLPDAKYNDHYSSVSWQLYRYENGRFIRVEVLGNLPPPPPQPPE